MCACARRHNNYYSSMVNHFKIVLNHSGMHIPNNILYCNYLHPVKPDQITDPSRTQTQIHTIIQCINIEWTWLAHVFVAGETWSPWKSVVLDWAYALGHMSVVYSVLSSPRQGEARSDCSKLTEEGSVQQLPHQTVQYHTTLLHAQPQPYPS